MRAMQCGYQVRLVGHKDSAAFKFFLYCVNEIMVYKIQLKPNKYLLNK